MESSSKIFIGYLVLAVSVLIYPDLENNVMRFLVLGSSVYVSFYLVATGVIELERGKRKKIAAELKDGDYLIKSSPIIETRKGISSYTHFEDMDKFDLQNAMNTMLDVAKSVHLFLEPVFCGPMRNYIIPAGKIPARFWPLILSGYTIEVKNGFVRNIYKLNKDK
ncbi:hypothetical protein KAK05_00900 [Candidatus Parcubacteria bacterium]|nr:hypothetical protein [Candidatus Parcubacteria bacterium]